MDEKLKDFIIKLATLAEELEKENQMLKQKYNNLLKELEKSAAIQEWLEAGKIAKHQVDKIASLIDEMGIEKTAELLSDITEIDYGEIIEHQNNPKGLAKFLKI